MTQHKILIKTTILSSAYGCSGAEYQSSWFSHSSFMYSCNWVKWWILLYSCKGSVTSTGITRWRWPSPPWKMICPKLEKQTNRQCPYSHKYEDTKDGTRNTREGKPALCQYCQLFGGGDMYVATWRTGKSTKERGEKHIETGGEQATLWVLHSPAG